MNELVPVLAPYGFPGAIVLVASVLLWRLIDRGFKFEIPSKPRSK